VWISTGQPSRRARQPHLGTNLCRTFSSSFPVKPATRFLKIEGTAQSSEFHDGHIADPQVRVSLDASPSQALFKILASKANFGSWRKIAVTLMTRENEFDGPSRTCDRLALPLMTTREPAVLRLSAVLVQRLVPLVPPWIYRGPMVNADPQGRSAHNEHLCGPSWPVTI